MTSLTPAQVASAVYQACTTYDQYLPQLSPDVAKSWAKVFTFSQLSVDDLLAGVDLVYREQASGYRPFASDIARAGRAIRQDRASRTPALGWDEHLPASAAVRAKVLADFAARRQTGPDTDVGPPGDVPYVNVLLVTCDYCHASVGNHCTTAGMPGQPDEVLTGIPGHPSRIVKAAIAAGHSPASAEEIAASWERRQARRARKRSPLTDGTVLTLRPEQ